MFSPVSPFSSMLSLLSSALFILNVFWYWFAACLCVLCVFVLSAGWSFGLQHLVERWSPSLQSTLDLSYFKRYAVLLSEYVRYQIDSVYVIYYLQIFIAKLKATILRDLELLGRNDCCWVILESREISLFVSELHHLWFFATWESVMHVD